MSITAEKGQAAIGIASGSPVKKLPSKYWPRAVAAAAVSYAA